MIAERSRILRNGCIATVAICCGAGSGFGQDATPQEPPGRTIGGTIIGGTSNGLVAPIIGAPSWSFGAPIASPGGPGGPSDDPCRHMTPEERQQFPTACGASAGADGTADRATPRGKGE